MPSSETGDLPPLALIAGPTASGKSDLAVRLAIEVEQRGVPAVVINADSAQVYADLRILSARPEQAEMRGVEHRLFGAWDGADVCSAADWANSAREQIERAHRTGNLPILVGGTGLYLRTLLDGIAPVPQIDDAVRAEVRGLPVEQAHAALCREDPDRAARLDPGDRTRIGRALEVVRSTGISLSDWQTSLSGGIADRVNLHTAVLLPPRDWLYERCNRRFEIMMERGAIAEVELLLSRNLDPALPVMRAIGVPEIAAALRGEISFEEAVRRGAQATRNYAKRQFTWFRNQPPLEWKRIASQYYDATSIFASLLQHLRLT